MNRVVIAAAVASAFLLAGSAAAKDKPKAGQRLTGQRQPLVHLQSITDRGEKLQLVLENGVTLEVSKLDVWVKDETGRDAKVRGKRRMPRPELAAAQIKALTAAGATTPTLVRVISLPNGMVRKVKIYRFASETDASAFLSRDRRTSAGANERDR